MSTLTIYALTILATALQSLPPYPALPPEPNVRFVVAIDGPRTLLVRAGTRVERLTLAGIAPPAPPAAGDAQRLLRHMLVGERVHCGRRGVVLRLPDGWCPNLELVRCGLTQPGTDAGVVPGLAAYAAHGQQKRAGDNLTTLVVTRTGSRYHRPGCPHARKSARTITPDEARARYKPCGRCKPDATDLSTHPIRQHRNSTIP